MITEPQVTSNAIMLLGVIAGALHNGQSEMTTYRAENIDPVGGEMIVESHTGNRYRIRVEQISGTE